MIRQAMAERRRLAFTYHSRSAGEKGKREVDPHALVYYAGDWHLLGYCHRSQEARQFRLSRMEAPTLQDARFAMPEAADARDFWANRAPTRIGDRVARVRFLPQIARWARERRHYACEGEEETDAGLVMTLRVERWEEILPWLLGWGGDVTVLDPPELRERIAAEARRVLSAYGKK
jgi:predicted DNA-binding transcriptional regulator YafY